MDDESLHLKSPCLLDYSLILLGDVVTTSQDHCWLLLLVLGALLCSHTRCVAFNKSPATRVLTLCLCMFLRLGASRGFAFVEFSTVHDATRWMEAKQVSWKPARLPTSSSLIRRAGSDHNRSAVGRGVSCHPHQLPASL